MAVLILKVGDKDFRGIGLVEFLWKTTTGVINLRLTTSILYHDSLHGFRAARGMRTAILENNPLHHLISMKEAVLRIILFNT